MAQGSQHIRIEEFSHMLQEARAAFEDGQMEVARKISAQFQEVGYTLIVAGGTLHLWNETIPRAEISPSMVIENVNGASKSRW